MSEHRRDQPDATGVADNIEVVVKGPDGKVKERVGRRGLRAILGRITEVENLEAESHESLMKLAEDAGIEFSDEADAETRTFRKKSRPSKAELLEVLSARRAPMRIGEVLFEGTRQEIKGPGPEWEKDENGEYVNR